MGKNFSKTRIPEMRKAEIISYMTEIYTHKQRIVYTWDYKKSTQDLRITLKKNLLVITLLALEYLPYMLLLRKTHSKTRINR